jgi:GAF domain-containing protein
MSVPLPSQTPPGDPAALARRLAILDAIAAAIGEAPDLSGTLERALATVLEVTGVDGGGVFLLDEVSGELRLTVHRGASPQLVESFRARPGQTLRALASDPNGAVVVRDLRRDAHRPEIAAEQVRAYAAIPLQARGQVLGVLIAFSHTCFDFQSTEVELLASIGRQVGAAVERARLYERERRRALLMEAINAVGRRLGAVVSEGELLPQIVGYVCDHLGYEAATLFLVDPERERLTVAAAAGFGNEAYVGRTMPLRPRRSIVGWVAARNEPLLANDVTREPRYFRHAADDPCRAELAVPIRIGGTAVGVLDVQSSRPYAFHEMDVHALQTLAGQIAVALQNARLHEATRRSLQRTRALQQVSSAMRELLDLPRTLDRAIDAAMEVFEADRAGIFLLDGPSGRMDCAASRNLSAAYLRAVRDFYAGRPAPTLLENRGGVYLKDATRAGLAPPLTAAARREGFRSVLFLPLAHGDEMLGTFVLYHNRVRRYNEEEIDLAQTFADQAAVAIQHARLFEAERRARDHAATILEATRTVTSSLRLEDVVASAATSIAAALGETTCGVWLLDDARTTLTPVCCVADAASPAAGGLPVLRVDEVPRLRRLLEQGEPVVVDESTPLSPVEAALRRTVPFHTYVAVPLVTHDRAIGIAAVPVTTPGRCVGREDIEVAMAIGRSVALAVENARLYEQSRRLAVSEERNRLARELHDSVTHSLFSITLIAQALPRILERDPARARERIERLTELGRSALTEMRALIFELRPATLDEEGLAVALTKHVEAFEAREGMPVELTISGEHRPSAAVEETVFRVAQEALNNVAKHARATRAVVHLALDERAVELAVTDDGRGFDPVATRQNPGRSLGMTSMAERAMLVGGVCTVESAPGAGTTLRLRVPLEPSPSQG